jgi:hypothetical protein
MVTAALSSFGTLLKKGNGATPEVFTTIAELTGIGGFDLSLAVEDATNMNSPGGIEEVIATLGKGDSVTFDINFVPTAATHGAATGLVADWQNKTRRNFQMVLPDAGSTTWSFPAYVTKISVKAPVKGKLSASVTLTPAGQPTLA